MNEKWKKIIRKAFIAAFWLMLWWGLSLWVNSDILVVSPRKGLAGLWEILAEGTPNSFFSGNNFYTTAASRIAREIFPNAVLCDEVISLCR